MVAVSLFMMGLPNRKMSDTEVIKKARDMGMVFPDEVKVMH